MQQTDGVSIVQAWQDAMNHQDRQRLAELSDPQIELIGPRGSAYGIEVLREWLERAGLTLTTWRTFARDDVVVVAQHGMWQSAATGGVPSEADVASVFRVKQGRVTQYARYDTLNEALQNVGLTEADEIAPT